MDDIKELLRNLTKYFEGNYECTIGVGDNHISLKTDEEVLVITVTKESLDDWD